MNTIALIIGYTAIAWFPAGLLAYIIWWLAKNKDYGHPQIFWCTTFGPIALGLCLYDIFYARR